MSGARYPCGGCSTCPKCIAGVERLEQAARREGRKAGAIEAVLLALGAAAALFSAGVFMSAETLATCPYCDARVKALRTRHGALRLTLHEGGGRPVCLGSHHVLSNEPSRIPGEDDGD